MTMGRWTSEVIWVMEKKNKSKNEMEMHCDQ